MAKKKKLMTVGAPAGSDKEMRKHAMERYEGDYHFKRGIRVSSPVRDPYSYESFIKGDDLNQHFYGVSDPREIKMAVGKGHGFTGMRTANAGHSIYGKSGKKGHLIGKR
jgi:hypothetical protein